MSNAIIILPGIWKYQFSLNWFRGGGTHTNLGSFQQKRVFHILSVFIKDQCGCKYNKPGLSSLILFVLLYVWLKKLRLDCPFWQSRRRHYCHTCRKSISGYCSSYIFIRTWVDLLIAILIAITFFPSIIHRFSFIHLKNIT